MLLPYRRGFFLFLTLRGRSVVRRALRWHIRLLPQLGVLRLDSLVTGMEVLLCFLKLDHLLVLLGHLLGVPGLLGLPLLFSLGLGRSQLGQLLAQLLNLLLALLEGRLLLGQLQLQPLGQVYGFLLGRSQSASGGVQLCLCLLQLLQEILGKRKTGAWSSPGDRRDHLH